MFKDFYYLSILQHCHGVARVPVFDLAGINQWASLLTCFLPTEKVHVSKSCKCAFNHAEMLMIYCMSNSHLCRHV